jgi:hypothetical protein
MPSILVHLDEPTLQALNRVTAAVKRQRAEFIGQAVKDAIRKHEYARIREAYRLQPDSASEADDWSSTEEWRSVGHR